MTKPRSKPIKQTNKPTSQSTSQSTTQPSNNDNNSDNKKEIDVIPDEFVKVIYDLINDILYTFPEFKDKLHIDLYNIKESKDDNSIKNVYEHIKTVFPERFFDILYKNEEMFGSSSEINTEFLPGIDFKELWADNISEKTKETIWKYLQVILFSVIGKVNSEDSFGDTAKLFEAINQNELKGKLEETMNNLQNMMDSSNNPVIDVSGVDHLPNPEDIQDHINGLLDGKLGKLAKEIATETADELNFDTENATSVNDVFKNLFKDPTKLMGLVKNVGGKLDNKIKSGEIKESEIMQEASELLTKMKDMPGMGDIQSMLKKMGMGGIPGMGGMGGMGGKMDVGAMGNALNQNLKKSQMKERMLQKSQQRREEKEKEQQRLQQLASQPIPKPLTESEIEELVFSIEGETPEKTMRCKQENKSNKKKKKKGKNK